MNLDKRRNPIIQEVKRAFFYRNPTDTAREWIASEYEPGNPWSLVFAPVPAVTTDEEKQAVKILDRLARFDLPEPPIRWFVFGSLAYEPTDLEEFDNEEEARVLFNKLRKDHAYSSATIIEGKNRS